MKISTQGNKYFLKIFLVFLLPIFVYIWLFSSLNPYNFQFEEIDGKKKLDDGCPSLKCSLRQILNVPFKPDYYNFCFTDYGNSKSYPYKIYIVNGEKTSLITIESKGSNCEIVDLKLGVTTMVEDNSISFNPSTIKENETINVEVGIRDVKPSVKPEFWSGITKLFLVFLASWAILFLMKEVGKYLGGSWEFLILFLKNIRGKKNSLFLTKYKNLFLLLISPVLFLIVFQIIVYFKAPLLLQIILALTYSLIYFGYFYYKFIQSSSSSFPYLIIYYTTTMIFLAILFGLLFINLELGDMGYLKAAHNSSSLTNSHFYFSVTNIFSFSYVEPVFIEGSWMKFLVGLEAIFGHIISVLILALVLSSFLAQNKNILTKNKKS